jgi:MFS family permease
LAARRAKPEITMLAVGAAAFGCGCALAAVMPTAAMFGLALIIVGVSAQTVTTSTLALAQLSTDAAMRGRVMAILLAVALGGTPIGAPIVGRVADAFGPRWALALAAGAGLGAAVVALRYLVTYRHLSVRFDAGRPRIDLDAAA